MRNQAYVTYQSCHEVLNWCDIDTIHWFIDFTTNPLLMPGKPSWIYHNRSRPGVHIAHDVGIASTVF